MKKDQKIAKQKYSFQKNHSQISIITIDNNDPTIITLAGDLQIKEFYNISHKIDIAGLILQIINFKSAAQDQTQTEVFTQIIIETVCIQMLGKKILFKQPF